MNLTLRIENFYAGDPTPVVTNVTVDVPKPPCPGVESDDYNEWANDHIFPETGTGRGDGESGYFVECMQSDVPWMIGRTWEFL